MGGEGGRGEERKWKEVGKEKREGRVGERGGGEWGRV